MDGVLCSRSRSRSHGRVEVNNPGNTLYVTGLSTRVTERELEKHFSKEGKVASCFLVVEPRTRVSRGFAFVTMDSLEDANRCIKYLNQSVLEGRYITVERNTLQSAMLAAIKDDEFIIHVNLSETSLINGQLKQLFKCIPVTPFGNFPDEADLRSFQSRRKRPRTPTPGHYLGLKSARDYGKFTNFVVTLRKIKQLDICLYGHPNKNFYCCFISPSNKGHRGDRGDRGDRGRYRSGRGDDYDYRRSPRRSPFRGGRDYSPPVQSPPHGGRMRRERSRSLPRSPYGSPDRRHVRGSR
ncbi:hypothetical protein JRO89_XS08G0117000 [Xanthoceras sorbifolium]|uniref:RRM domain-containing protein n=1 Tax=Xanthoceras sorbifolium TaxID=99658 RepID=A0ABQ8HPC1_9ROSI|nr:hypothetical protein JRO89_XS08G0117000 [Xanthoceras sorbifolium]